jgi:hypothetical protein
MQLPTMMRIRIHNAVSNYAVSLEIITIKIEKKRTVLHLFSARLITNLLMF